MGNPFPYYVWVEENGIEMMQNDKIVVFFFLNFTLLYKLYGNGGGGDDGAGCVDGCGGWWRR